MSRSNHNRSEFKPQSRFVEVKSKLDAEYRRFVIDTSRSATMTFDGFHQLLQSLHHLGGIPFTIWFTDNEGDLLPINNDDNFASSVKTAKRLLRLSILKSGQSVETLARKRNTGGTVALLGGGLGLGLLGSRGKQHVNLPVISPPEDFRRVSAIIDIDVVPETCRRVKLMKSGASDRPLGFYIRDGASIRVTAQGLEKVSGVFISRLAAGGLAESTGLLAVGDEILEVNGIEVYGKTLDQVTDMMVANSNNLIVTVKPVNQHNNVISKRNNKSHQQSYRIEEEERVDAEVPNPVSQYLVSENVPRQNVQANFPSVNPSETRSAPRVSARTLPSGVQVLEL